MLVQITGRWVCDTVSLWLLTNCLSLTTRTIYLAVILTLILSVLTQFVYVYWTFYKELNLRLIDDLLPHPRPDSVTFRVVNFSRRCEWSFIYHWPLHSHAALYGDVISSTITYSGAKLSDHCALAVLVKINSDCKTVSGGCSSLRGRQQDVSSFRWDKADLTDSLASCCIISIFPKNCSLVMLLMIKQKFWLH